MDRELIEIELQGFARDLAGMVKVQERCVSLITQQNKTMKTMVDIMNVLVERTKE